MSAALKTFRCRVRAGGYTLTLQCLAPSAHAAAYAVVERVRQRDQSPWHQVVASEWSSVIGEWVVPANAIVISASDPAPEGADRVVLQSIRTNGGRRDDIH
ncbi:MAG TPA: hypothetical protein VGH20_00080 [Myxococcales bacterium]